MLLTYSEAFALHHLVYLASVEIRDFFEDRMSRKYLLTSPPTLDFPFIQIGWQVVEIEQGSNASTRYIKHEA